MRRLTFSILVWSLAACSSSGGGNDSEASSSSSSSSGSASSSSSGAVAQGSHNAGENCMTSGCHEVGSPGANAPEFYAAGTIFSANGGGQQNAIIRMYVKDTNTLVAQLATDASGNFYTSEVIDELHVPNGPLVTGVNVTVEAPGAGLRTMPGVVSDAYCNLCHRSGVNGRLVF